MEADVSARVWSFEQGIGLTGGARRPPGGSKLTRYLS